MDGEMERVLPDDADDGAERRWIDDTLNRLSRSSFRAKFELSAKDRAYARAKGKAMIDRHARELLRARIGAANPRNDGRQTPWRGHPVFTAQHATATCCRGCIAKWHHLPQGRELTDAEIDRLADLVMAWIERDLIRHRRLSSSIVLHPPRARHTVRGRCCRRRKKYEGDYNRDFL